MVLPQRKFRELVFQMIFSHDLNADECNRGLSVLFDQLTVTKKNLKSAHERMQMIFQKQDEIDKHISKYSKDYDFQRISRVERNILRLGVYELLFDELPPKVVLSEAVRLSRKFGTPEGGAFVNAVLDAIHQRREPAACLTT